MRKYHTVMKRAKGSLGVFPRVPVPEIESNVA